MVCALAEIRLILFVCILDEPVRVAQGVLVWQPIWPVYRSRLLAPSLLRLLGDTVTAYLLLTFIALAIGGWLSWQLSGLVGLAIFHAAFALLLGPLFYPWDVLEPVLFMAFVSLVAGTRSPWWFVALFAVTIFNRQPALFMAAWMVTDPLCRWKLGARLTESCLVPAWCA